ncbi:MAG: hypothetical protein ACK5MT_13890 [Actinomycetales bacterium]
MGAFEQEIREAAEGLVDLWRQARLDDDDFAADCRLTELQSLVQVASDNGVDLSFAEPQLELALR